MTKVTAKSRKKLKSTRRVYVTLKNGRDPKEPTRHLTLYGVTIAQAERKILSLDGDALTSGTTSI